MLALNIIRGFCESKKGSILGPILVLSYKNHALDEFLLDVLEHSGAKENAHKRSAKPFLIRTGKAENEAIYNFMEKRTGEEQKAQKELNRRISTLRKVFTLERTWKSAASSFLMENHSIEQVFTA